MEESTIDIPQAPPSEHISRSVKAQQAAPLRGRGGYRGRGRGNANNYPNRPYIRAYYHTLHDTAGKFSSVVATQAPSSSSHETQQTPKAPTYSLPSPVVNTDNDKSKSVKLSQLIGDTIYNLVSPSRPKDDYPGITAGKIRNSTHCSPNTTREYESQIAALTKSLNNLEVTNTNNQTRINDISIALDRATRLNVEYERRLAAIPSIDSITIDHELKKAELTHEISRLTGLLGESHKQAEGLNDIIKKLTKANVEQDQLIESLRSVKQQPVSSSPVYKQTVSNYEMRITDMKAEIAILNKTIEEQTTQLEVKSANILKLIAAVNQSKLLGKKKDELVELCKKYNIKVTPKMKKEDILNELRAVITDNSESPKK